MKRSSKAGWYGHKNARIIFVCGSQGRRRKGYSPLRRPDLIECERWPAICQTSGMSIHRSMNIFADKFLKVTHRADHPCWMIANLSPSQHRRPKDVKTYAIKKGWKNLEKFVRQSSGRLFVWADPDPRFLPPEVNEKMKTRPIHWKQNWHAIGGTFGRLETERGLRAPCLVRLYGKWFVIPPYKLSARYSAFEKYGGHERFWQEFAKATVRAAKALSV